MQGLIIGKKYKLIKKIGSGAFGQIWKAIHITNKKKVAVKIEDLDTKHQQLYIECKIYLWFHSEASVIAHAIPSVIYYGTQNGKNVMIMDLLGPSLESLMSKLPKKFSVKTTLMLADQMIKRIEYVH